MHAVSYFLAYGAWAALQQHSVFQGQHYVYQRQHYIYQWQHYVYQRCYRHKPQTGICQFDDDQVLSNHVGS